MSLAFHVPINSVSFGQISFALVREAFKRKQDLNLFAIKNSLDFSAFNETGEVYEYTKKAANKAHAEHSRRTPIFKLWHLNESLDSFSKKQVLLTFYELDSPTDLEVNIAKQNDVVFFSSEYTVNLFKSYGVNAKYLPLAFDSDYFKKEDIPKIGDRITFNVVGKLEKRKRHKKLIRAWLKKYGNNPKYFLQCAIHNPFLKPEENDILFKDILEGKNYFNVQYFPFMQQNSVYNSFLNSGDIILGMSGGEGWGLPEFQSVALGKHAVILNANGYKGWANKENSVLVEPSSKIPAYDKMFFIEGRNYNQGNIFDFKESDFISACEEAVDRVCKNSVNSSGLKLKKDFTYSLMFDTIMKEVDQ